IAQKAKFALQFCDFTIIACCWKITTRQGASSCPRSIFLADLFFNQLKGMFGKATIGCQLSAENIEKWSRRLFVVEAQYIISGRFLSFGCAIVIEWTNSRIGPDDIIFGHW